MLRFVKEFLFGKPVSDEERKRQKDLRKRARMHMIGAGGGSIKAKGGFLRVEKIHADSEVRDDGKS